MGDGITYTQNSKGKWIATDPQGNNAIVGNPYQLEQIDFPEGISSPYSWELPGSGTQPSGLFGAYNQPTTWEQILSQITDRQSPSVGNDYEQEYPQLVVNGTQVETQPPFQSLSNVGAYDPEYGQSAPFQSQVNLGAYEPDQNSFAWDYSPNSYGNGIAENPFSGGSDFGAGIPNSYEGQQVAQTLAPDYNPFNTDSYQPFSPNVSAPTDNLGFGSPGDTFNTGDLTPFGTPGYFAPQGSLESNQFADVSGAVPQGDLNAQIPSLDQEFANNGFGYGVPGVQVEQQQASNPYGNEHPVYSGLTNTAIPGFGNIGSNAFSLGSGLSAGSAGSGFDFGGGSSWSGPDAASGGGYSGTTPGTSYAVASGGGGFGDALYNTAMEKGLTDPSTTGVFDGIQLTPGNYQQYFGGTPQWLQSYMNGGRGANALQDVLSTYYFNPSTNKVVNTAPQGGGMGGNGPRLLHTGGRISGKDKGYDSINAMVEPGEDVLNKDEQKVIQLRPGWQHMVTPEEARAIYAMRLRAA